MNRRDGDRINLVMELELKDGVERIIVKWKTSINWKSSSGESMESEFSDETSITRHNSEVSLTGKTLTI